MDIVFLLWVWNNVDRKERKTRLFLPPPVFFFFCKAAEGQLTYFLCSAAQGFPHHLISSLCLSPEACLILKGLALVGHCKGGNPRLLLDCGLRAECGQGFETISRMQSKSQSRGKGNQTTVLSVVDGSGFTAWQFTNCLQLGEIASSILPCLM